MAEQTADDLLERGDALALEMALPGHGIHRRYGETVLNLLPVPHHPLEQFALRFRHATKLPFLPTAHEAQSSARPHINLETHRSPTQTNVPTGSRW